MSRTTDDAGGRRERKRKGPHRMTPEIMREVAVAHLQRFPCSVAHLRRVLKRKIDRSVRHHGDPREPLIEAMEAAIVSLDGGIFLDDRRYAAARVTSLHHRGKSRRAIAFTLRTKGVDAEAAAEALTAVEGDAHELAAAAAYARRRRLGPFHRDASTRRDRRQKDLAALGRQGFGYGIARAVIDAGDPAVFESDRWSD